MAKEPDNLVLKLLREIRAEQGEMRDDMRGLRDQMSAMQKEMTDWQETISTAAGSAMHANLRSQKIEAELAALRKRVEKLEKAR
jgi:septal ring factor EnvC (AmiA/AmiB activator)